MQYSNFYYIVCRSRLREMSNLIICTRCKICHWFFTFLLNVFLLLNFGRKLFLYGSSCLTNTIGILDHWMTAFVSPLARLPMRSPNRRMIVVVTEKQCQNKMDKMRKNVVPSRIISRVFTKFSKVSNSSTIWFPTHLFPNVLKKWCQNNNKKIRLTIPKKTYTSSSYRLLIGETSAPLSTFPFLLYST